MAAVPLPTLWPRSLPPPTLSSMFATVLTPKGAKSVRTQRKVWEDEEEGREREGRGVKVKMGVHRGRCGRMRKRGGRGRVEELKPKWVYTEEGVGG